VLLRIDEALDVEARQEPAQARHPSTASRGSAFTGRTAG